MSNVRIDSPDCGSGIQIANLTKIYSGMTRPAVDDASLDVGEGELMTLLGPSGSGKTTLLSAIAGFVPIDRGKILIGGQDVSRLKPYSRDLGVVFQHYALFPHMTVARNVAYPLEQRRMPKEKIKSKVRDALSLVHLEEYSDRLPRQLSGGQQQRVALARAVVYNPRALLLDEPLGALDKKLREELRREIARMHRELRMTFIFVTHDQEEALTLSDRVAVFNEGVLEQVGTPEELYDQPRTLFTGQFLGDSNAFYGRVNRTDRRLECSGFALSVLSEQVVGASRSSVALVRPERLQLHDDANDVPPGQNSVGATVTEVTYVGSHYRVGLTFSGGAQGAAMSVAGASLSATPGSSVVVSWDPHHQSLVADPEDGERKVAQESTLRAAVHEETG